MEYIYETHLHTREASACSRTPAVEYIHYMKELGYAGIIVTDHFFTGNSAVPKNLPWEQRVEWYYSGYEHALEAAGNEITVLFGVEYNFQGDEFLLYGVTKDWLLDNPDLESKNRYELYDLVHEAGGIMIQAHPYRERGYLSAIHLTPDVCDGIEVYNAANPDWQNSLAYEYALEREFLMGAGSDIHYFEQNDMGGMSFPYPIETIDEYVKAFLAGDGTPVYKRDASDRNSVFEPVSRAKELTVPTLESNLKVIWH